MKLKKFTDLEFIKANKKTLICFIMGMLGIAIIFASEVFNNYKKENVVLPNEYISYSDELEKKLENLISSVDGAGKTSVLLTIEENEERIYAQNTSSNIKPDSQNSIQQEFVIVDDNGGKDGLLIKTVNPKIRGVAVVCEGGDNPKVQQRIYSCISASLGVSTARISISKMSSTEVNYEK